MKKILIPVIIVLLLLVGAVLFMRKPGTDKNTMTGSTAPTNAEKMDSQESEFFAGTIADLLKRNVAMKCQSSFSENEATFNGTYYINPTTGMTRIDMTNKLPDDGGKIITSHMVVDKSYMYSWQEGEKTGFKFATDVGKSTGTVGDTQTNNPDSQLNRSLNFNCVPGTVDESYFRVPSDINFQDMSAGIKQMMDAGTDAEKQLDALKQMMVTPPVEGE